VVALALRTPLTELFTDQNDAVSALAVVSRATFAAGFGAGVPAGNALVARGRSRDAFAIRIVDAVPIGLAIGTFVGAFLLLRRLRALPSVTEESPVGDSAVEAIEHPATAPIPNLADDPFTWDSVAATRTDQRPRTPTTDASAFAAPSGPPSTMPPPR